VNARKGNWFLKPPIRIAWSLARCGTFVSWRCFIAALVVLVRRSLSKRAKRPEFGTTADRGRLHTHNARASVAIAERVFHAAITAGKDERDGITGPH
jgi:hypothetical protein